MSNIRGYRIIRAGVFTYIPQANKNGHWVFYDSVYSNDGYIEFRVLKFWGRKRAEKFLADMGAKPEQIKEYHGR